MMDMHERDALLLKFLQVWEHDVELVDGPMTSVPMREEELGKLRDDLEEAALSFLLMPLTAAGEVWLWNAT
jgi:hypothetical protein